MHPLALAESGWVWVGAGSRPAGLRAGRAIPGLRRDAALPVRQNTRQGREGGALPKPLLINLMKTGGPAAVAHNVMIGANWTIGLERDTTTDRQNLSAFQRILSFLERTGLNPDEGKTRSALDEDSL